MRPSLPIGRHYKALRTSGGNDETLIPYAGRQMTKNQWALTSKDSIFQMFERAIANYNSGFGIAQPPLPPEKFSVTSGPGKIVLAWETYQGATQNGWEIYRKAKQWQDQQGYELLATLDGAARRYEDKAGEANGPQRGIDYFYYIQAVGDVNNNATGKTPTGVRLKSGRYYTQTYLPPT